MSGAYAKIIYHPEADEVIKVNRNRDDLLGLRYPAEYDITCRLEHPHLISAKRITPDGHLVFPYYPYTLWSPEVISLPLNQKKVLLDQLICGIDALHNAGYLHLDIKGNNILINEHMNHLVLADFGSALFVGLEDGKESPRNCIIDDLKAPELLVDRIEKRRLTYRRQSDYWSVGIVCLELMSGTKMTYRQSSLQDLHDQSILMWENKSIIQLGWGCLLTPAWKNRKLPSVGTIPANIRPDIMYTSPTEVVRPAIKSAARRFLDMVGHERVEAFFVGINLFVRSFNLPYDRDDLILACYWIGLKLVEGCSVDPREIDPLDDRIEVLSTIEASVVSHLKGRLYYPNVFTDAESKLDLLVAWRYLYQPSIYGRKMSIRACSCKNSLTLEQYLFQIDLL